MKRCPECRRDYHDDSLLFCLDDGSSLLDGPASSEPPTLLLETIEDVPREAPTEVLAGRDRRSKKNILWVGGGIVVILGLIFAGWKFGRSPEPKETGNPLGNAMLMPLTNDPGYEGEPTFSPDGETIAYVSDRSGNFEIYIQQVSGGAYRNISENSADDVQPAYSPDGKQLAFVSSRSSATSLRYEGYDLPLMGGDIWVMPALGGNARKVAKDGNFPSWSPDGKSIIYTSGPAFGQKIYRVSSLGGESKEIVPKLDVSGGIPRFLLYPSYSSDERRIVFEADSPTGFGPRDIWVMNAESKEVQHVARGLRPCWNSDSTAIVYSSAEPGKNFSLWQIPFSSSAGKVSGAAEPLTVSRGRDVHAAVSRDGSQIAFSGLDIAFNIETQALDVDAGKVSGAPVQITTGRQVSYFQSFSPDAQTVVFESRQGLRSHLWKVQRGSSPVQLTDDPASDDTFPRWSPVGRNIAFNRKSITDPSAAMTVWLITDDGANPHQVIDKAGNYAWTPDGRGLVYFSMADRQLHVFDLTTSADRQLTNEPKLVQVFAVSNDGKWVVYQSLASGNSDLKRMPFDGGDPQMVVATPHQDYHPFFTPSGQWVYYIRDHKNLFRAPGPAQNWRPAEPQQVTTMPESGLMIDDPQVSNDGKQLLYTRGNITGDIWLMKVRKANLPE